MVLQFEVANRHNNPDRETSPGFINDWIKKN